MSAASPGAIPTLPPTVVLARAVAALRIFFGIILLANGLAKVFGVHDLRLGPYSGNLITRDDARGILDGEVNRSNGGTRLPLLKPLVNNVVLPNWEVFQWLLTLIEVSVGIALVAGLASRLAALVDLGQQLFLAAVFFSSNRWVFEQPHDYVPLILLVIVPSGRVLGLDGRLLRARQVPARWPF